MKNEKIKSLEQGRTYTPRLLRSSERALRGQGNSASREHRDRGPPSTLRGATCVAPCQARRGGRLGPARLRARGGGRGGR